MCMFTVKEANEKETGNGWPREAPPSSGRDASLMFKDLIVNTQALGCGVVDNATQVCDVLH